MLHCVVTPLGTMVAWRSSFLQRLHTAAAMPTRRPKPPRLIETDADVMAGVAALRRKCPVFRKMHGVAGIPPLRRRPGGFEGLSRIIVGQQLSVASAAAIWTRTALAVQPFEASVLLALSDEPLRGAGLSASKVRTLRAIAAAVAVDGLDLEALDPLDDAAVHAALTGISGIGPWTADIFLMFCLGRADAFATGEVHGEEAEPRASGRRLLGASLCRELHFLLELIARFAQVKAPKKLAPPDRS